MKALLNRSFPRNSIIGQLQIELFTEISNKIIKKIELKSVKKLETFPKRIESNVEVYHIKRLINTKHLSGITQYYLNSKS